jgi:hypothetical protein
MANQDRFTVDDLPRYSPWPARLLGPDPCPKRYKTPEEVMREYEYEKWGVLLTKVRETGREVSVEEVDAWTFNDLPDSLCSIEGTLQLLSAAEAHQRYLDLLETILRPLLPASALVELGAGYGSIILSLAKRDIFKWMRFMAGEYTASGMELIQRLARAQGLEIEVGQCNFALQQVTDLTIPPDAVIFTSYATPYVPKLSVDFINALAIYRPRAVVHMEPCYEHCDAQTLLGLLRRRYIEVNDYNTNLITLLHSEQKLGRVEILNERPAIFGGNPLLAVSVLVWRRL